MLANSLDELIDVIDDANLTVGRLSRREAYALGAAHRIVHVLVVQRNKVLITRRSLSARYMPGAYCTSAGGHVGAGESSEAAALREMHEEIGLSGPITFLGEFFFTDEFKVHISVYVKVFDKKRDTIRESERELLSTEFMTTDAALTLVDNLHPQLKPCLQLLNFTDGAMV